MKKAIKKILPIDEWERVKNARFNKKFGSEEFPNFSPSEGIESVKKLSNLWGFIPPHMDEGMKSNARFFGMLWQNPLVKIFVFMGLIVAVLKAVFKKDKK